jgi:hypothetical protein
MTVRRWDAPTDDEADADGGRLMLFYRGITRCTSLVIRA